MSFRDAVYAELLKARRSRVPRVVALGFSLAPLIGALFMLILKDPERARGWGLLGTKAQIAAGVADWPTYLALLAQATAIGGLLVFSFVVAWIFGREFADRTLKELLATPTSRAAIVAAKATTTALLVLLLTGLVLGIGLPLGYALDLPGGSADVLWLGIARVGVAGLLTLALMPVFALLATVGRGYLVPLGCSILAVFLAQIAVATGWGAWFPFAVPALYSGAAGPDAARVGAASHALVLLTALVALAATFVVWSRSDQAR